jgi:hypothetical protein
MSGSDYAAAPDVIQEVRVSMTMRYSSVWRTLQNILIPQVAAARDVVNAWWKEVNSQHVTDPNILGRHEIGTNMRSTMKTAIQSILKKGEKSSSDR